MENKDTVMDAKIVNLNELTKVLSVKEQAQEQLLVVMKALGIGKIVRNLKFEKAQGYTLTSLFISLLIMRLWGKTIASATSNHFHGLCAVSKNTLYRALLNARIDWRMLLTKITLRFHAILREHQVNTDEHDTCAILDDTTFQKSGIRIEGVSKVFDHVTHNFIYGMKCLTLALSDGKSCYPIDFSLHREKGKKKDYGLTLKQRKEQFKEKRNTKNPDYARKAECDESKLEMARRFSEYETLGALFRSERDRLQVLTLWSRTLEEVRHLLEVLSREAGVDLLACLSTVATRQMADFSTKVWAHLLCDSDDYAMPDLD